MKRVLIIIYSLDGGGAERFTAQLASWLANVGYKVGVATFEPLDADKYVLPSKVDRLVARIFWPLRPSKNIFQKLRNWTKKFLQLRNTLLAWKPDAVIAIMDISCILAILSLVGSGIPVIVSEHTDPRYHRVPLVWRFLRRLTYPWAAALVVQTEAVARGWARRVVPWWKVRVIPYPCWLVEVEGGMVERLPWVVGMGRLVCEQKGFDVLLEAFSRVAGKHPGWRLMILGEGPDRGKLERMVGDLGLVGRVELPGWVGDPERWLRRAGVFVLSSRYEGFPNVLLEAMSLGCAVVAADCPSGPGEIVRDGVDGFLVPVGDVEALAGRLDELMGDEGLRRRLGERAWEVRERFSLPRIMGQWEELLGEVAGGRATGGEGEKG